MSEDSKPRNVIEPAGESALHGLYKDNATLAYSQPAVKTQKRGDDAVAKSDRYSFLNEIGRGGMGYVVRGRDNDLGREVALKVLLASKEDRPDLAERFIEEAQIGGQLQHPGIAPVHEMGELDDGRPFFSMKLVRGRTLNDLLNARKDNSEDLAKFIGIFEQVCQAIAYAHSRGVIHRDLKPDNIMVGAFGEVMVMDWGLAKVVGEPEKRTGEPKTMIQTVRSGSRDGVVGNRAPGSSSESATLDGVALGTPSYMPPEQAKGELDAIDFRSDVFALGGILCKVLTGRPPYTGGESIEIVAKAAEVRIDEALMMLNMCGADAELVDVAVRCMAANANDRPRDAGEVTKLVNGYQESVADRLRRAELKRVEAETQAKEEAKRRRVQLALAITMGTLLLLASGGWVVYQQSKTARVVAVRQETELALEQAHMAWGRAKEAGIDGVEHWVGAAEAIKRARAVAARDGDSELRAQVQMISERIENDATEAKADRRLLKQLAAATDDVAPKQRDKNSAPRADLYGLLDTLQDGSPPQRGFEQGPPNERFGPPPHPQHDGEFRPQHPPRHHFRDGPPGGRGEHRPPHQEVDRQPQRGPGWHDARDQPLPVGGGELEREGAQAHHEILAKRFEAAFAFYGMTLDSDTKEVAKRIKERSSVVKGRIIDSLDRWLNLASHSNDARVIDWILAVHRQVEQDNILNEIRRAVGTRDVKLLENMARDGDVPHLSPTLILVMARQIKTQSPEFAIELLERAHRRRIGDPLINQALADMLRSNNRGRDAVAYYTISLAVRPHGRTFLLLGHLHEAEGNTEDAIAMYRLACEAFPGQTPGYRDWAQALRRLERFDEAMKVLKTGAAKTNTEDIEHWTLHYLMGVVAEAQGNDRMAIDAYRNATELAKDLPPAIADRIDQKLIELRN